MLDLHYKGRLMYAPSRFICECCSAEIDVMSDMINMVGDVVLCDACIAQRVPQPGEKVIVIREGAKYGYSFVVDAVRGNQVLLKTGETFESYRLSEVCRFENGKTIKRH